ncbi:MAG: bacterio-opsin activator [Gammaproteobacteria bacterium]|nr:MAG: bacterio-opsin activator [Gammaproteobacteria bacterium]
MVIEIKPIEKDIEPLVTRVFLKSIDIIGGLQKLAEYRTLTWLPSLARASFVIVLREEYLKTEDEIAEEVGITKNTVRQILRADPQTALYKIQHLEELSPEERKQLKVHTAGGIAKIAYKLIKEGEETKIFEYYCTLTAEALEVPWAYLILKKIKGTHFPVKGAEELMEKLKGVTVKGVSAEEILQNLEYPIRNPAELLHKVKMYLKVKENL